MAFFYAVSNGGKKVASQPIETPRGKKLLMKTYTGSCHCQAILFEVKCSLEMSYQCDCSICSRKNAKMVYADQHDFTLLHGKDNLTCYQFNTDIAEHYFCKTCGIYTFHKPRMLPDKYGINSGCLEGVNALELPAKVLHGSAL